MPSKRPPLRAVKKKNNVVRLPGTEPPEEILNEALEHVRKPGTDVTAVMVILYDSRNGFDFTSTAMSPESHALFCMELEQRVRHHFITRYSDRKPDPGAG